MPGCISCAACRLSQLSDRRVKHPMLFARHAHGRLPYVLWTGHPVHHTEKSRTTRLLRCHIRLAASDTFADCTLAKLESVMLQLRRDKRITFWVLALHSETRQTSPASTRRRHRHWHAVAASPTTRNKPSVWKFLGVFAVLRILEQEDSRICHLLPKPKRILPRTASESHNTSGDYMRHCWPGTCPALGPPTRSQCVVTQQITQCFFHILVPPPPSLPQPQPVKNPHEGYERSASNADSDSS